MKNRDTIMLEEAYNLILEAKKKKLTPKEKKIAGAAAPYDKITRADIITLAKNKNKKTNNESTEHCKYAAEGCDCDGCEECIKNQKGEHCKYAAEGCDCNGCKECKANQKS